MHVGLIIFVLTTIWLALWLLRSPRIWLALCFPAALLVPLALTPDGVTELLTRDGTRAILAVSVSLWLILDQVLKYTLSRENRLS